MKGRMLWEWSREWCCSGVGEQQSSAEGGRSGSLTWVVLVHPFILALELLRKQGKSLLILICKVSNDSTSVMGECISDLRYKTLKEASSIILSGVLRWKEENSGLDLRKVSHHDHN